MEEAQKTLTVPELVQEVSVLSARLTQATETYGILCKALDKRVPLELTYSLSFQLEGEQHAWPSSVDDNLSELANSILTGLANKKATDIVFLSGQLRTVSSVLDSLLNTAAKE